MQKIDPADLVNLSAIAKAEKIPLKTDLIYADAKHPLNQTFKEQIYRKGAKLWLHKDLAKITLRAAHDCFKQHALTFVVTDGLRTVDAQQRMVNTEIVKANPAWTTPGDALLISAPGTGGHPRAMAVDIMLIDKDGNTIDMGTQLDHFSEDPNDNPADRAYKNISDEAKDNRALLESLMVESAQGLGLPLFPLPSEWWDFRMPNDVSEQYAPLHDADLPPEMRMCS